MSASKGAFSISCSMVSCLIAHFSLANSARIDSVRVSIRSYAVLLALYVVVCVKNSLVSASAAASSTLTSSVPMTCPVKKMTMSWKRHSAKVFCADGDPVSSQKTDRVRATDRLRILGATNRQTAPSKCHQSSKKSSEGSSGRRSRAASASPRGLRRR